MKATLVCTIEGCSRPWKCAGYCSAHYSRILRTGSAGAPEIRQRSTCSVDGCERAHYGRGWCQMHHARWCRHGDPLYEPPFRRPEHCLVDGCDSPVEARGWCKMHYSRWWEGREVGTAERIHPANLQCKVPDCERPNSGLGYCQMHYTRWKTHGDPDVCLLIRGGDDIGYVAAHERVRAVRGSASTYACAHCGSAASDWAYDHADPNERRVETRGNPLLISLTPDHYIPLCRVCHRNFDLASSSETPVIDCGFVSIT